MYYVISYKGGEKGCPVFFDADLNEEWEWDEYDPQPDKYAIHKHYVFQARHPYINFDYGDEYLASSNYIELCKLFGMRFREVPVTIIQSNKRATEKKYFFVLSKDYRSILDTNKSVFKIETNPLTGEPVFDAYIPDRPHYESIEAFVVAKEKAEGHHIFRCPDIGHRYVCSEEFKFACLEQHLLGLAFEAIDANFRYTAFW